MDNKSDAYHIDLSDEQRALLVVALARLNQGLTQAARQLHAETPELRKMDREIRVLIKTAYQQLPAETLRMAERQLYQGAQQARVPFRGPYLADPPAPPVPPAPPAPPQPSRFALLLQRCRAWWNRPRAIPGALDQWPDQNALRVHAENMTRWGPCDSETTQDTADGGSRTLNVYQGGWWPLRSWEVDHRRRVAGTSDAPRFFHKSRKTYFRRSSAYRAVLDILMAWEQEDAERVQSRGALQKLLSTTPVRSST